MSVSGWSKKSRVTRDVVHERTLMLTLHQDVYFIPQYRLDTVTRVRYVSWHAYNPDTDPQLPCQRTGCALFPHGCVFVCVFFCKTLVFYIPNVIIIIIFFQNIRHNASFTAQKHAAAGGEQGALRSKALEKYANAHDNNIKCTRN